ncbi:MAG: peptidyl-prolyl cis-trans isomerase [Hyphomicrobiales bacterium]|nr:peptidyl-prolyl cis-trans isomerase [Hyphomicrobiales bacterium]
MPTISGSGHEAAKPQRQHAGSKTAGAAFAWRAFIREPLVQFLVLGGLIFGADAVLHPPAKEDQTIVVSKALRQSFIDNFDEDKERVPSPEVLAKMVDSWVASETLYREGKRLGVDRGDDMIRDRIAFKLQTLIFDQIKVEEPTEAMLRDWFKDNHAQFDEPERVSFYLTSPTDEATARRELDAIEAQVENETLQQTTRAIIGRPVSSIAPAFGEDFRDALLALPLETWSLVKSTEGWQVVRLDSRHPSELASFDQVKNQVVKIWKTEETRKRAWDAVSRLKASYAVRIEQ